MFDISSKLILLCMIIYSSKTLTVEIPLVFFCSEFPIDYNLYRKFWSLQDFFRKPGQCYEKKPWSIFIAVSF